MREILFRGKRKDNGEWVEGESINTQYDMNGKKHIYIGVLFSSERTPFMQNVEWHEVIPETVGQYTGLTEIFEGDIVEVVFRYYNRKERSKFKVIFYQRNACFSLWNSSQRVPMTLDETKDYKVIGNIHDNPELLKGGAE